MSQAPIWCIDLHDIMIRRLDIVENEKRNNSEKSRNDEKSKWHHFKIFACRYMYLCQNVSPRCQTTKKYVLICQQLCSLKIGFCLKREFHYKKIEHGTAIWKYCYKSYHMISFLRRLVQKWMFQSLPIPNRIFFCIRFCFSDMFDGLLWFLINYSL